MPKHEHLIHLSPRTGTPLSDRKIAMKLVDPLPPGALPPRLSIPSIRDEFMAALAEARVNQDMQHAAQNDPTIFRGQNRQVIFEAASKHLLAPLLNREPWKAVLKPFTPPNSTD